MNSLSSSYGKKKDIAIDIFIILAFTFVSLIIVRDLIFLNFAILDLTVPNNNPIWYLKWAFQPINSIGLGGSFLLPVYPTLTESFFTFLVGNVSASKVMTILPLPLSFALFFLSTRLLGFKRIYRTLGASAYAVSPVSFALFFSWGQQWFYAILPLILVLTYRYTQNVLTTSRFPWAQTIIISITYAIALSFMPQGLLLVIPLASMVAFYNIFATKSYAKAHLIHLLSSVGLVASLTFIFTLPYSADFLLSTYSDYIYSAKFVSNPFLPSPSSLYENMVGSNSIRLAGVNDFHIGELGFNELTPITIVGLSYSIIFILTAILGMHNLKIKELTKQQPSQFHFLIIVLLILVLSLTIVQLARAGLLWHLPLSSLLRSPLKPMMLISLAMSFLAAFFLLVVSSIRKKGVKHVQSIIFILLIISMAIYNSKYLNGTVWIKPVSEYWRNLGYLVDWKDSLITPSMLRAVEFAKNQDSIDAQSYRYFIFPLMPTQILFFRYNMPIISGDAAPSTDALAHYTNYINLLNTMILSGDKNAGHFLALVKGKYIVVLNDTSSLGYSGPPRKWGGYQGTLTGNPESFTHIVSNLSGVRPLPGRENIFVNEYALPLLSYVKNAILIDGNIDTVRTLYDYLNVRNNNNTLPIVIFKNQLPEEQTRSLLASGMISAVVHNNTREQNNGLPDIYLTPTNLLSKYIDWTTAKIDINLGSAYNFNKTNNAVWLKTSTSTVNSTQIIVDNQSYKMKKSDNTTFFFNFSYGNLKDDSIKLRINGNYNENPIKEILFLSSSSNMTNLEKLTTSQIYEPKVEEMKETEYALNLGETGNKIVLLSQLYDTKWNSNSNMHIPVYGFLNGFVLTGGQTQLSLEYSGILPILDTIFMLSWFVIAAIIVFLVSRSKALLNIKTFLK